MSQIENLPVFPIDAHIFPGGKLKLRLFEPRYIRLIKERGHLETAFAMAMYSHVLIEQKPQLLQIATVVKIIDFEPLDDGFLGITVEGQSLVMIDLMKTEDDGLHIANCKPLPEWEEDTSAFDHGHTDYLKDKLLSLYKEYPDFLALYPHLKSELNWLVMRWLEVLPVPSDLKLEMLQEENASNAVMLVRMMLDATESPPPENL
ncbi:MAG: LON peptidase substrate-binding domain-containing protein [Shewanellaceae bacterium]|nr:LON peptidase substrate-binding domain-containing protein [Shewanellaceae bacterium]